MTDMQLLEYLQQNHTGQAKAVSSRVIETVFQVEGTVIRTLVNRLRCDGHPVCSDQYGYFYADSTAELEATIRQLSSRISKIARAKKGLLQARSHWPDGGQTSLPI